MKIFQKLSNIYPINPIKPINPIMPKQTPLDISLDRFADALEQAARKDIPHILGQAAVDAFKQNFQDEGFFGSHWKEVKRRQGHARGAAASRPILTGNTGNLGRSIDYEVSDNKATVFSDLPYASAHNEGTTTAGRNNTTTIPKRQFIGNHQKLDDDLEQALDDFLDRLTDSIL